MDKGLHPLEKEKVECYIDDLIIKGTSFEQHLKTVREVLQRLSDAGLMCNNGAWIHLYLMVSYVLLCSIAVAEERDPALEFHDHFLRNAC